MAQTPMGEACWPSTDGLAIENVGTEMRGSHYKELTTWTPVASAAFGDWAGFLALPCPTCKWRQAGTCCSRAHGGASRCKQGRKSTENCTWHVAMSPQCLCDWGDISIEHQNAVQRGTRRPIPLKVWASHVDFFQSDRVEGETLTSTPLPREPGHRKSVSHEEHT